VLVIDVIRLADLPTAGDVHWTVWLTASELATCRAVENAQQHLGARLAGKQCIGRLLGLDGPVPWLDLEISRVQFGPPGLTLTGSVERHRFRCGYPVPELSLSHAGGYATAIAWLPETPDDVAAIEPSW
jgi:holo-[acyl-carrier protein] synthase